MDSSVLKEGKQLRRGIAPSLVVACLGMFWFELEKSAVRFQELLDSTLSLPSSCWFEIRRHSMEGF